MSRDRILFGAVAIILVAAALFILIRQEEEVLPPDLRDESGSAFDLKKKDTPQPVRVSAKEVKTAQPPRSEKREAPVGKPVTTQDDFGNLHGAVEVFVTKRDGTAFVGATVGLFQVSRGILSGVQRGARLQVTTTDETGLGTIDRIEVGQDYALRIQAPGYRKFEFNPLKLTAGEVVSYRAVLGDGYQIHGTVRAANGGVFLAGARVSVYDLNDLTSNPEDAVERQAYCDEQGKYACTGLSGGPKRVCVEAAGFGGKTKPYVLLSGLKPNLSLDFELDQGVSIQGMVVDVEGKPIPQASVAVSPVKGGPKSVSMAWYPSVQTDDLGRFEAQGLQRGYYFLRASKPGFAPGNFGFGKGERRGQRRSMINAQAPSREIELVLGQGPRVTGRVVDDRTGMPIRAFDLFASSLANPKDLDPKSRQRFVGEDGVFDFSIQVINSQARFVHLHARAPGFSGGHVVVDFAKDRLGVTGYKSLVEAVEIPMMAGSTLVGRVLDAGGRPLEKAKVEAMRKLPKLERVNPTVMGARGSLSFSRSVVAISNKNGQFEVKGLPMGTYRIRIDHPDAAAQVLAKEIEIREAGDSIALGELRLTVGGKITGFVRAGSGKFEEGARVMLEPVERGRIRPISMRTGLSGRYEFEHVPVGQYRLYVSERNGLHTRSPQYRQLTGKTAEITEVNVLDGVVMSLDL